MSTKTERLESLLEAAPGALVGLDQQGMVRFVSHQAQSLFGTERDDLVGQPIQKLLPEYLGEVCTDQPQPHFSDLRARSVGLDLRLIGRRQDGIVTFWNPAAKRMFGYTSEEMTGTSIERLCPAARAGEIDSILAQIRAGRPVERFGTIRIGQT